MPDTLIKAGTDWNKRVTDVAGYRERNFRMKLFFRGEL